MSYNPFTLKNKIIFITGASSGIGRAAAIECSRMGAKVIITGRNEERLNETFKALEGDGHLQFIVDFNDLNKINDLIDLLPNLSGVVHCAGYTVTLPFQFSTLKVMEDVMNVNFMAPAIISQELIKKKKIAKGGSFVFISSISGVYVSIIGNSIYSASKGAIHGLVKSMALELAPKEIRVNSVNPGMIETGILEKGLITKEQLMEDMKKYPLKRYGKPDEVAHAVIYLLSDASKWVTGSNLVIDGGYTIV